MKFKKNSAVVKAWVRQIQEGKRTYEDVPKLGNLREVVKEVLEESEDK